MEGDEPDVPSEEFTPRDYQASSNDFKTRREYYMTNAYWPISRALYGSMITEMGMEIRQILRTFNLGGYGIMKYFFHNGVSVLDRRIFRRYRVYFSIPIFECYSNFYFGVNWRHQFYALLGKRKKVGMLRGGMQSTV